MWTPQLSKGQETSKVRNRIKEWTFGKGLDVGCGLDKISAEAIGVDLIPLSGVDFLLDARDLYIFKDGEFDYVFSSHVLEDLEDPINALIEWLRVLKVNGHLILYLPHKDFYPNIGQEGANPAHKHDFTGAAIIKILFKICRFRVVIQENRNQNDEYSFLLVIRKTGGLKVNSGLVSGSSGA